MRAIFAFALGAALAMPAAADPAPAESDAAPAPDDTASAPERDRTSGVIATEEGWIEIFDEAPAPGTTIRLQEGWIRVESAPEDEEPGNGSFGVIQSPPLTLAQDEGRVVTEPQPGLRAGRGYGQEPGARDPAIRQQDQPLRQQNERAAEALGACYAERERYVKELFRIAGIERTDHPLALLQALGDTPGLSPWVRLNLFGLAGGGPVGPGVTWIDPVRPLAWDDALRWRAKELESCMRHALGFDDRLVDPDVEREAEREAEPTSGSRATTPPRGGTL